MYFVISTDLPAAGGRNLTLREISRSNTPSQLTLEIVSKLFHKKLNLIIHTYSFSWQ